MGEESENDLGLHPEGAKFLGRSLCLDQIVGPENVVRIRRKDHSLGSVGAKKLFKRFALFRLNGRKSGSGLNFACFLDELDKLFVLTNSLLFVSCGFLVHYVPAIFEVQRAARRGE